jgi:guanyl-specific ribonuclease Sa
MRDQWAALNFPSGAAWHQIGTSQWIYGGAVHQNRERQLPTSGRYREYDAQIYTRRGESRGAKRIIIDISTYAAWYSPNHYTDFYVM